MARGSPDVGGWTGMRDCLSALGSFHIFRTGSVVERGLFEISHEQFLNVYQAYQQALKEGRSSESSFRPYFSSVLSVSPECLYRQELLGGKAILNPLRPVVQMQVHRLGFSAVDGKFRPMVFGKDSIEWGIGSATRK